MQCKWVAMQHGNLHAFLFIYFSHKSIPLLLLFYVECENDGLENWWEAFIYWEVDVCRSVDITPLCPRSCRPGALERCSALVATGNLTNRGQAPIRKSVICVFLPALIEIYISVYIYIYIYIYSTYRFNKLEFFPLTCRVILNCENESCVISLVYGHYISNSLNA